MTTEMQRIAVIINGDIEERHQRNTDMAIAVLEAQGYETYVASTKPTTADHFYNATEAEIMRMLSDARAAAVASGSSEELVIYTTGHGNLEDGIGELCIGHVCKSEPYASALDDISFRQRSVIMDQCFSGNWSQLFLDDPRTMFLSAGCKNDPTCCGMFSPYLWTQNVPDANSDGVISWQERYANAIANGQNLFSQYLTSPGYREEGKPPFEAQVQEVSDAAALTAKVSQLQPGQYAIIMLASPGCHYCELYKPEFERMAGAAGGQFLFLYTGNDDLAREMYGVVAFPTVLIVGFGGMKYEVKDRDNVLGEFREIYLNQDQKIELILEKLSDPKSRIGALGACQNILRSAETTQAQIDRVAAAIRQVMNIQGGGTQGVAIRAYMSFSRYVSNAEVELAAPALREVVKNGAPPIARCDAAQAYSYLAERVSAEEAAKAAEQFRWIMENHADPEAEKVYRVITSRRLSARDRRATDQIFDRENRLVAEVSFAYCALVRGKKLADSEKSEGASTMWRVVTKQNLNEFVLRDVLDAFTDVAGMLPDDEAVAAAPVLRRYFGHRLGDLRRRAIIGYGILAKKLSPDEIAVGAKAIRGIIENADKTTCNFAMGAYGHLIEAGKLSNNEVLAGALTLRNVFTDPGASEYEQYGALINYKKLIDILPREELNIGAFVAKNLFRSYDGKVRSLAVEVYKKVASRLPGIDLPAARTEAEVLRKMLYADSHREEAVEAYVALMKNMPAEDIRRETGELLEMFGNSSLGVRETAGEAFAALVRAVPSSDAETKATLVKMLHGCMFGEDQNPRLVAARIYGGLADVLSQDEIFEGMETLRAMFDDDLPAREDVTAYEKLASRLSVEGARIEMEAIRPLLASKQYGVMVRERILRAYLATAPKLAASELARDAGPISAMLGNPVLAGAAAEAYALFAGQLPADDVEAAVATLRARFNEGFFIDYDKLIGYLTVARELPPAKLKSELGALVGMFDDSQTRYYAVWSYVVLAGGAPATEEAAELPTFSELLRMPGVGPIAARAFTSICAQGWTPSICLQTMSSLMTQQAPDQTTFAISSATS